MRPPLSSCQPSTRSSAGSNHMMQRCVEKIMERTNVSEVDARQALEQRVVKQARTNDLTKPPTVERSASPHTCRDSPVAWSSPPLPPQPQPQHPLNAFPRLTRSLSPRALANFQQMLLSRQPGQKGLPIPYPEVSVPPLRPAQYDSPPQSPRPPAVDDARTIEQAVDLLSRSAFDSLDLVLPTPSQDRAMSAPMFSRRGGLACGAIEGLRPVAVPYSGSWHDARDLRGGSPRGLMAVTLRPGQSSIVDLRSQCTDGLLLLSTTASFVPRAQAQAAC